MSHNFSLNVSSLFQFFPFFPAYPCVSFSPPSIFLSILMSLSHIPLQSSLLSYSCLSLSFHIPTSFNLYIQNYIKTLTHVFVYLPSVFLSPSLFPDSIKMKSTCLKPIKQKFIQRNKHCTNIAQNNSWSGTTDSPEL